ncbi:hypothetical protein [Endozoicomonas sp. 8E]|uniref:hypothetical protein n=1 Tax=Endozoicomonas sp. 8E TaxID=3035692 RepID=UPI0029394A1D|nr:hypothetical protein [Endozoicomonas sp. 8E]WOG26522.1 hypothetical protein P6910_18510 [Endozoicomonas sp. 8E]
MSQCEKFELVEKIKLSPDYKITTAIFSADGCHVLTIANKDKEAQIYGLGGDESWVKKATIRRKSRILSATISSDGRHVLTINASHQLRITELQRKGLITCA